MKVLGRGELFFKLNDDRPKVRKLIAGELRRELFGSAANITPFRTAADLAKAVGEARLTRLLLILKHVAVGADKRGCFTRSAGQIAVSLAVVIAPEKTQKQRTKVIKDDLEWMERRGWIALERYAPKSKDGRYRKTRRLMVRVRTWKPGNMVNFIRAARGVCESGAEKAFRPMVEEEVREHLLVVTLHPNAGTFLETKLALEDIPKHGGARKTGGARPGAGRPSAVAKALIALMREGTAEFGDSPLEEGGLNSTSPASNGGVRIQQIRPPST